MCYAGRRKSITLDRALARKGLLQFRGVPYGLILKTTETHTRNPMNRVSSVAAPKREALQGALSQIQMEDLLIRISDSESKERKAFHELFSGLWDRVCGCSSWDAPSVIELAATLTGGGLKDRKHMTQIDRHIEESYMSDFFAFV